MSFTLKTQDIEEIKKIIGSHEFKINEPLKNKVTFKCGGNAAYYASPTSRDSLILLINYCKTHNLPFVIFGNGSNVLVSDKGYDGIVIDIKRSSNNISIGDSYMYAGAGNLLSKLAHRAYVHELTGLEFASGIPGTLGGAIVMNAGAYGFEMKDIIETVDILDDGVVKYLTPSELDMSYRHTNILSKGYIVLGAKLKLSIGIDTEIKAAMDDYSMRRTSTQPLEYPSAGSAFKRPEDDFAARLIDEANLKGLRVGGASVSYKHSGFIINDNNATSSDVYELINKIKESVKDKFGKDLEPEIKFIGEF